MLGIGKRGGGTIAIVDIGSGSAGIAIARVGSTTQFLALARESLPFEQRSQDALEKGVLQALSTAGEKILKELSNNKTSIRINECYCIIGAPWTRSVAGEADLHVEPGSAVTDQMISGLATQALADQKDIEHKNLLEANVARVLLNGYPTEDPAGKHAEYVHIFTLFSECDADFKNGVQETLTRLFPDVSVTWRSGARAALTAAQLRQNRSCLIATTGAEATDIIVVRKGILAERALVPIGVRNIASSFAEGKPVEETIALLDMLEKEQCEDDACKALEASIARAEPELAHVFGETLAKLSASRKLPDELLLVAPPQMCAWLSRFYSRIDFTQFTVSTRPFAVSILSSHDLPAAHEQDSRVLADPGLFIGCTLVNRELHI